MEGLIKKFNIQNDNLKLKNDFGIRDGVKNFIDFCGVVDWGIDRM